MRKSTQFNTNCNIICIKSIISPMGGAWSRENVSRTRNVFNVWNIVAFIVIPDAVHLVYIDFILFNFYIPWQRIWDISVGFVPTLVLRIFDSNVTLFSLEQWHQSYTISIRPVHASSQCKRWKWSDSNNFNLFEIGTGNTWCIKTLLAGL